MDLTLLYLFIATVGFMHFHGRFTALAQAKTFAPALPHK